jgi:16S rRNA G966 N2-methylase RsmD
MVTDNSFSLLVDIKSAASNSELYHVEYLQNMRVQIDPPNKENNIPQGKQASILTHQGANHTALKIVLYTKQNKRHAYIVGNSIREVTEAAKSTKKSHTDFLQSDQEQIFILRTQNLNDDRK